MCLSTGLSSFFPAGFLVRARLVMLVAGLRKMWPIHLQRRCWKSTPTGFCFIRCHSSSFPALSGHRIWRIHLRQLLVSVWILLVVVMVVLNVLAPYRRTVFTLVLKSLILVLTDRSLELWMSDETLDSDPLLHLVFIQCLTALNTHLVQLIWRLIWRRLAFWRLATMAR